MENRFFSMGEVLVSIKKSNITDIDERASRIQAYIDHANSGSGYEYDRFLEFGASNFGNVVTENSGNKKECILWCVNHYLSLNRNANVIARARDTLLTYGTGCGTSAASCGMSSLHKELESRLAGLVGKEKALLYPTGFTANTAAISYLTGKEDLIIFDRESHSSIINGLKLSEAKWISFKHNNVQDLALKLKRYRNSYQNIFVLVEAAYSMSGDLAPLKELVSLKKEFGFYLYVDEAHTFGIYGDKGQGYCHDQGVSQDVDFIMATLSKSTAAIGGFVAAKKEYCSLLKWSDPYVFQACIPPADASVILACLDEIEQRPEMISELHAMNSYMRGLLLEKGFNLGESQSPIIPIFIEDHRKLQMVARDLYQQGVYSTPICFPAVKVDEGRIRLILNAAHTREHIHATVEALETVCKRHQVIGGQEDSVTGLYNRAFFDEKLEKAFNLAVRQEQPLSIAIVAVDNFRQIFTSHPAGTGDKILNAVGGIINASMRSSDIASRYDEEAFALMFFKAEVSDMKVLCERLIDRVQQNDWSAICAGEKVTVSIGLVDSRGTTTTGALMKKALECLDRAQQMKGSHVSS
ncbi:aminotransferase class I/II-fold pyridoxal phosphate-dependent enzyme [Geopsychrobacter electrodiphilus]|uniref:aminotransferase class I/II-fold pyridoxal phosphate-dependent enzyme n=1 Tax=Geopsychrobacter electrodiphilus TaxID=225196 RepID=UPI000382B9D5|nr:aminotransferase class I/II-fold pyridoxal phosphate-dependent enzyme [Geopsychrobacter electrodiphilus]